ncbi:GNAT family protein [Streptomyces sp. NPDC048484]|uniref:GNAT family N-acetyltransferase n=1 Tax=Streptomyces sp. NPDC048484 TaxID=3155146 RepID=UPI00343A79B0
MCSRRQTGPRSRPYNSGRENTKPIPSVCQPRQGAVTANWLAPAYTGHGLATSAVAALTCQAFELPGIEGVEIDHDVLNHASRGIPERLGFARSHVRTRVPQVPGESGVHQIWRLDRAAFMRRTW